jgi:hypothetical protein
MKAMCAWISFFGQVAMGSKPSAPLIISMYFMYSVPFDFRTLGAFSLAGRSRRQVFDTDGAEWQKFFWMARACRVSGCLVSWFPRAIADAVVGERLQ